MFVSIFFLLLVFMWWCNSLVNNSKEAFFYYKSIEKVLKKIKSDLSALFLHFFKKLNKRFLRYISSYSIQNQ